MHVDATIRAGRSHHIGVQLEIPEFVFGDFANVEQVRALTVRYEGAVFDHPGFRPLCGFPAGETLAILQRDPVLRDGERGDTHRNQGDDQNCETLHTPPSSSQLSDVTDFHHFVTVFAARCDHIHDITDAFAHQRSSNG